MPLPFTSLKDASHSASAPVRHLPQAANSYDAESITQVASRALHLHRTFSAALTRRHQNKTKTSPRLLHTITNRIEPHITPYIYTKKSHLPRQRQTKCATLIVSSLLAGQEERALHAPRSCEIHSPNKELYDKPWPT